MGILERMPNYRRALVPGGTFFFTVVTEARRRFLTDDLARACLHDAIVRTRADHPLDIDAMVLLPDHLHAIWTLPPGDADFSTRWRLIKSRFTRAYRERGGEAAAGFHPALRRASRGERDVWQPRFWEHVVRDRADLNNHLDYIHYNPVKHGLASCPHAWPHSSFQRWVASGGYERTWLCACDGRAAAPPLVFDTMDLGEWD